VNIDKSWLETSDVENHCLLCAGQMTHAQWLQICPVTIKWTTSQLTHYSKTDWRRIFKLDG